MKDFLPPPCPPIEKKRLLAITYDRNKPVIIVGKGPSARYIPSSDKYYVCCLNTSGRLTDKIDFQFLGDYYVYKQMCNIDGYFDKMENIIYPVEFNLENPQKKMSKDLINLDVKKHLNQFEYTFDFHNYPETEEVRMYTVISSGEVALAWLLDEGFKTFYTVGIDPYAPDNVRHHVFESIGEGNHLHPNMRGGMLISYNRMMKRIALYDGSMSEYED
jgi:hypothetical protein